MVEKIEDGMNLVSYVAKYQHLNTKTHGKPKSHKEKPQIDSIGGRTAVPPSPWAVVDTTGNPWWWPSRVFLPLPERCILYLFLSACFACVGSFCVSFSIFFDLRGSQKHLLIL